MLDICASAPDSGPHSAAGELGLESKLTDHVVGLAFQQRRDTLLGDVDAVGIQQGLTL